jgi:hypothetical protein
MIFPASTDEELSQLLGQESPVNPGDSIDLGLNLFTGPFTSHIQAPADDGIRVEGHGVARLDGGTQHTDHVLTVKGGGITFNGIEITHGLAQFEAGRTPSPAGLSVWGDDCVFEKMRVHNCGQGFQSFGGGRNLSIQNSDIYHCGASELDHALYMHNPTSGYKRIIRNRIWGNTSFPLHWYGSADVRDMFAFDNVFWNNDIGHVVCGGSLMTRLRFFRNAGWYPRDSDFMHLNCSLENAQEFQDVGHDDLWVIQNYFAGGNMVNLSWWRHVLEMHNVYASAGNEPRYLKIFMGSHPPVLDHCIGNQYYVGDDPRFQYDDLEDFKSKGFEDWKAFAGGLDTDSRVFHGWPKRNYYHVAESLDGTLTVAVFNWENKPVVLAPIAPWCQLKAGETYSVEYCASPGRLLFRNKVFDGHTIGLPMVNLPASPKPARVLPAICEQPTAPDFAVFLIRKT